MPRSPKKNKKKRQPKGPKPPDGSAIAFSKAHDEFEQQVAIAETAYSKAVDAVDTMLDNAYSPAASRILFGCAHILRSLVRRLQRFLDRLG